MNYLESLDIEQELINGIIQIVTGAPNVNIAPYLDSQKDEQIIKVNKKMFKEIHVKQM